MFALTPRAASVLAETLTVRGLPRSSGVRISAGQSNGDGATYHLRLAEGPGPEDDVIEAGAARLFVAPEVAKALEAAILDAESTASGKKLVVRPQR